MTDKTRTWMPPVLSSVIAVILFTIANFILFPSRAMANQVADHEIRIRLEEQTSQMLVEEMKEVNRKLDKIIDLFIEK